MENIDITCGSPTDTRNQVRLAGTSHPIIVPLKYLVCPVLIQRSPNSLQIISHDCLQILSSYEYLLTESRWNDDTGSSLEYSR